MANYCKSVSGRRPLSVPLAGTSPVSWSCSTITTHNSQPSGTDMCNHTLCEADFMLKAWFWKCCFSIGGATLLFVGCLNLCAAARGLREFPGSTSGWVETGVFSFFRSWSASIVTRLERLESSERGATGGGFCWGAAGESSLRRRI